MRSTIFIVCIFCSTISYCQKIDYNTIRNSKYLSTCGSDSLEVFKAHKMLIRTNITEINKNLDVYYHDLGYIYYKMSLLNHDKKYLDTANIIYKKALRINPNNKLVLWDGGIALVFSKHCKEGLKWLNTYIKMASSSEVDTESLNNMKKICGEK